MRRKAVACAFAYIGACSVATAAALASRTVHAQPEIKLTVAAGHPITMPWVKHLRETFIPTVNSELARTGRFRIGWNEVYSGAIARLGAELEAIESGAADVGIVNTALQPARMPLQQLSALTPFGPTDARVVTRVMNDMHQRLRPMSRSWEQFNQVHLTGFSLEDQVLVSTQPIARIEDLASRRIGVPPPSLAWFKGAGLNAGPANPSSYPNDLRTGVFAAVLSTPPSVVASKIFETAPHVTRVGFGALYMGALSVNRKRWDALPREVRSALQRAGEEYSAAYEREQFVRSVNSSDSLRNQKVNLTTWSDAERARLARAIENPTIAWVEQLDKQKLPGRALLRAYMDAVRAEGVTFSRDWERE